MNLAKYEEIAPFTRDILGKSTRFLCIFSADWLYKLASLAYIVIRDHYSLWDALATLPAADWRCTYLYYVARTSCVTTAHFYDIAEDHFWDKEASSGAKLCTSAWKRTALYWTHSWTSETIAIGYASNRKLYKCVQLRYPILVENLVVPLCDLASPTVILISAKFNGHNSHRFTPVNSPFWRQMNSKANAAVCCDWLKASDLTAAGFVWDLSNADITSLFCLISIENILFWKFFCSIQFDSLNSLKRPKQSRVDARSKLLLIGQSVYYV